LLQLIYGFKLKDDELDNLTLDYISFSENKVNKGLVLEFIMTLILKKREVLVNEVEFRLTSQKTMYEYQMTEIEFCNVMEEFFFVTDDRQIQIAYETSLGSFKIKAEYFLFPFVSKILKCLAHSMWEGYQNTVPVNKLAHIAAYFGLIQTISELKDTLNNLVIDARQKILENELKLGPGMI
jgi:hypothetical protein